MTINKYAVWLAVAVMIFCAGMAAGVYWLAPALTTHNTVEKQPIYIQGQTVTETKLQYVPGETVYLPAPDGTTTAAKLDGKFTIDKPNFVYEVNGKPGVFTKAEDERYVLDKNMIALTQTSTINIKADIPTIDKTKNGAIGIGYGTNGPAVKLDIKKIWFYADRDTKAAGIQYRF